MKKKIIITIIAAVITLVPIMSAVTPHVAHAGYVTDVLVGGMMGTVYEITGYLAQLLAIAAGAFLAICGVFLNAVMILTLDMKALVTQTSAIGIAWTTIRDFSSIFIIFMLLYASISMILGIKGPSLGALIKTIVIAGLLINFSLFMTKFLVDTSNIISLSFYSAIAPTSAVTTGVIPNNLTSLALSNGGIANVFMQSLGIQITPGSSQAVKSNNTDISIPLSFLGSAVLEVTAGFSFLAAALMFTIRIAILILLMAFSPIYFIAMIVPQVKEYGDKWIKMLYSMCVFMPVYLFLMYIAIKIINDKNFFSFINPDPGTDTSMVSAHTVGLVMQYVIAFIFINAPLLAAISVAKAGADFVGKMGDTIKKWGQGAISGSPKFAWRQTGGRAANALAETDAFKNIAGKSIVGELALKGTRAVGGDYAAAKAKRVKGQEAFAESLGHDGGAMATEQSNLRLVKTQLAQEKSYIASDEAALKIAKADLRAHPGSAAAAATVATLRANLSQSDANVKQFKDNIRTSEARSLGIETKRQVDFHTRTGFGLWNKYAKRSNSVASAKVEASVVEKLMKKAKEELATNKQDLKSLEASIRNSRNGQATQTQSIERTRLSNEIANGTQTVSAQEDKIEQLGLKK